MPAKSASFSPVDAQYQKFRSATRAHSTIGSHRDRNGDVAYTSSHTDDAGLEALAATTRQLAARQPLATGIHEGDQP